MNQMEEICHYVGVYCVRVFVCIYYSACVYVYVLQCVCLCVLQCVFVAYLS